MADIVLSRRGSNLRYKTPKLQVSVPAPTQSIIYDQCGVAIGKKVAGSFQIAGRIDCFNPVTEILRVSYRYFYNNLPLDLAELTSDIQDPTAPNGVFVPAPPGFLRTRTNFLNNPRLPIERSVDGANYPLEDVCGVTIGTVEDKNVQEYGYTLECQAISRYGFTTTVARHSSITDGMVNSNIATLSGFALLQQTAISPVTSNQDAMLTAWDGLKNVPLTISVGAFEGP